MAILESNQILFESFEPKMQNRFILSDQSSGLEAFFIKTVSAPSFTDEVVKLDHINSYKKVRGKREWGNIDMTLYDPINPSAAQKVMDWARLSYESVTERAGYSDIYKRGLLIKTLGPAGDVVSEWSIVGAFIVDANFGSYDWSSNEVLDISLTVAMDYCVLNY